MGKPQVVVNPALVTEQSPLGDHWDELPASTRRFFPNAAALEPQLAGYGGPKPSPTSNEDPLIQGTMRKFLDNHPSFGSVKNVVATGCPAIVHSQMASSEWKSTYRAHHLPGPARLQAHGHAD